MVMIIVGIASEMVTLF